MTPFGAGEPERSAVDISRIVLILVGVGTAEKLRKQKFQEFDLKEVEV